MLCCAVPCCVHVHHQQFTMDHYILEGAKEVVAAGGDSYKFKLANLDARGREISVRGTMRRALHARDLGMVGAANKIESTHLPWSLPTYPPTYLALLSLPCPCFPLPVNPPTNHPNALSILQQNVKTPLDMVRSPSLPYAAVFELPLSTYFFWVFPDYSQPYRETYELAAYLLQK